MTEANGSPHAHDGTFAGMHSHDGGALHWHDEFGAHTSEEMTDEEALLRQQTFKLENVVLTTVGVDVGSSTTHMMFSRVHMQRLGEGAGTRFVTVGREVLWKSPILFTPYLADDTIDAALLERFVVGAYHYAGAGRDDVDSGAVILTGEALKKKNSAAIGGLFAKEIGKFVCASAGHHLEAILAANGSGTVSRSRRDRQTLLNVDIGGGTTKLALVHDGEILGTAAIAIGGRLLVKDAERRLTRVDEPARQVAEHLGVAVELGTVLSVADEERIAQEWTSMLCSLIQGDEPEGLTAELMVTEPLRSDIAPHAITFSGGVSEFVYLRESKDFHDMGASLAKSLRRALMTGGIKLPVVDPGQGIRATAIGASQFTVQVSDRPYVTDEAILPLRNLPVLIPQLAEQELTASNIGAAIRGAFARANLDEGDQPVALAFRVEKEPAADVLQLIAEGVHVGLQKSIGQCTAFAVLIDHQLGHELGVALQREVGATTSFVSLDGIAVAEYDFIDVGEMVHPTEVIPVSIKSLLFAGGLDRRSVARALTAAKLESIAASET